MKLVKEVHFQETEYCKTSHILFPHTQLRKKMWSVFKYTPLLHQEGQKTEKPYITLSYYQICFLPLPMQFWYIQWRAIQTALLAVYEVN